MGTTGPLTIDPTIAVAGDICLDVVGVPIPPPPADDVKADNWQRTGEVRTYYIPGGAHLLQHFVGAAWSVVRKKNVAVSGPQPQRPASLSDADGEWQSLDQFRENAERLTRDEIVHSLLKADYFPAKPGDKKSTHLRILETHGYSGPKSGVPTLTIEPPLEPAKVYVLDDTGNRFRHTQEQWPRAILEPGDGQCPRVIYKLHRPLPKPKTKEKQKEKEENDRNPLWDKIQDRFKESTIVIVSVEDLRDLDVVISRGLSWERTALDVVWHLLNTPALAPLKDCSHLIVRFGLNGALYWHTGSRKDTTAHWAWLFYDPAGIEGTGEDERAGKMVGYGSVFTAAVAAAVAHAPGNLLPVDQKGQPVQNGQSLDPAGQPIKNEAPPIEPRLDPAGQPTKNEVPPVKPIKPAAYLCEGIRTGLLATRRLLEVGFGKRDPDKPLDFPGEELLYPGQELFTAPKDSDPSFPCQLVPIIPEALVPDRGYWRLLDSIFKGKRDRLEDAVKLVARDAKPAGSEQQEAKQLLKTVPRAVFKDLHTTDRREIENYRALYALMQAYIRLPKAPRPLSMAVFGPPGAGKSFGVKNVAEALGQLSGSRKLKPLTFNLSQYNHPDQLAEAFHAVRDIALKGEIPLVFFDEFDAALGGEKLGWLKYFLAPMQDAEFLDNGVPHPIGQAIFLFAGGTSSTYADFARPFLASQPGPQETKEDFDQSKRDFKNAKGPDFLSRLRGFLDIPGLDYNSAFDPYGPVEAFPCPAAILLRRAGILNFQLGQKAPHLKNSVGACQIKDNVLQALLYLPEFIHGNRSFEALLDMSSLSNATEFTPSDFPSRSHTALHADADQLHQLIGSGYPFPKADRDEIAKAIHEAYLPPEDKRKAEKRSHRPWAKLDADLVESNREQADHIAIKLRMINLWFRKVEKPNEPNTKSAGAKWMLERKNLDALAMVEHIRWVVAQRRDGWIAGPDNTDASKDDDRFIHNCLFPWEDLTLRQQDLDKNTVKMIPEFLAKAGYEIIKL